MSAWGKFLAPVTVPAGGWVFGWNEAAPGGAETVTVAAGSYATILHLVKDLSDELTAFDATYGATVSSVGVVTITLESGATTDWASTDDDLEVALGFAGSESVSGTTLTASKKHRYGWYPGTISFGVTNGAGVTGDSGWIVEDQTIRSFAGSGSARLVAPARRLYTRSLRYGPIKRLEALESRERGPAAFMDKWATDDIWWYFDRDDGVVGTYGTQVDPGATSYDVDSDGNYSIVTMSRQPDFTETGSNPDWFDVRLRLNAEPA